MKVRSDEDNDPPLYEKYNQEEQDIKDLKEGLARQLQYKKDDENAAKKRLGKDREILSFFDVKFHGSTLDNEFQLYISENPTPPNTFTSLVFDDLYYRISENKTVEGTDIKIIIRVKGERVELISDSIYRLGLLDYHYDLYSGDKKIWLRTLKQRFREASRIMESKIQFENSIHWKELENWIERKYNTIETLEINAKGKKSLSVIPSNSENMRLTFIDLFMDDYKRHSEKFKTILIDVTPSLIDNLNKWVGLSYMSKSFYKLLVYHKVMIKMEYALAAKAFSNEFTDLSTSSFVGKIGKTKNYADLDERIKIVKANIDGL